MEEKAKTNDDEIDLFDLFSKLYKQKWLILGITAISFLCSLIITFLMPKTYRAEALYVIYKKDYTATPISTYEEISDAFKLYQKNKNPEIKVRFTQVRGTNNIIKIESDSKTPETAVNTLNETVNLINNALFKDKLHKEIKEATIRLKFINKALEDISKKSGIIYDPSRVTDLMTEKERIEKWLQNPQIIYPSTEISVSNKPVKPKPLLNITVGIVSGLFIGIFVALLKDSLRERKALYKNGK